MPGQPPLALGQLDPCSPWSGEDGRRGQPAPVSEGLIHCRAEIFGFPFSCPSPVPPTPTPQPPTPHSSQPLILFLLQLRSSALLCCVTWADRLTSLVSHFTFWKWREIRRLRGVGLPPLARSLWTLGPIHQSLLPNWFI